MRFQNRGLLSTEVWETILCDLTCFQPSVTFLLADRPNTVPGFHLPARGFRKDEECVSETLVCRLLADFGQLLPLRPTVSPFVK